jgi:hypothetical protein
VPGGRFALSSVVLLANLRASPRCLPADRRGCFTEGNYGASSRSWPTTTTERAPLEQLAELTDELRRTHLMGSSSMELPLIGLLRTSLRIPCISRGGTSSRLLGVDGCLKVSDERASTMLEDRQVGQEHKRLWRLRSGR